MTVLRAKATDEYLSPRRWNDPADSGRRGSYHAPFSRQAQNWARGLEVRADRRREVIPVKRHPLPAFSGEGIRWDVLVVTLSLLLLLFLCVIVSDLDALCSGGSRIGKLSAGITSLEERNSLLREEISRAESRAFTFRQSDTDPERGMVILPTPEE